jgi:simple sugar transport system ATP-binding protein
MMVGRDVTAPHAPLPCTPGQVRLAVRNVIAPGLPALSFEVRGGEILGVDGVDGNGQIELAETLTGLRRAGSGTIMLDGVDVTRAAVAARVRAGMAYMPADRSSTALVRNMSVAENLMLRDSDRLPYVRGGLLARQPLVAKARELMLEYDIRASGPAALVARLSGGNQQKIVVARELDRAPVVLVAHQAAWGLDPGATRFVLDRVIALRDAGAAVLYISSELEEVLAISDRIAVMADGRFAGLVSRAEADRGQIALWMSGRAA